MDVVFAGGGTAGHVTPLLAIADEIMRREPHSHLLFCITQGGMEGKLIEAAGYETAALPIKALGHMRLTRTVTRIAGSLVAVGGARTILMERKPCAVLASGGYISFPVLRAAQSLGIPSYLHESNAVAGLASRVTAKQCQTVFLNLEEAKSSFPAGTHTETVGMPFGKKKRALPRTYAKHLCGISPEEKTVLLTGGSLGADTINAVCFSLLEKQRADDRIAIIIGTGRDKYRSFMEEAHRRFGILPDFIHCFSYINDMNLMLSAADLVVSRSGACTLAEATEHGRFTLAVPYPRATGNHQSKNAKALETLGGCRVFEEAEHTPASIADAVRDLLRDDEKRLRCEARVRAIGLPDAAGRIYDTIKAQQETAKQ